MTPGWRPRLAGALRERPTPVLVTDDEVVPAASLWVGSRRWVDAFRAAGLRRGDRVVLALPPSAVFVQVLVAALWEGLVLAPVPAAAGTGVDAAVEELDARLAVVPPGPRRPGAWSADGPAGPPSRPTALRPAALPPAPEASLLLRTSGTTGAPRWVALSERNVCAVLDSHLPALALRDAHVVSVLPWHHAFGLLLDLLPALLSGAYLVRDPSGGRDPAALAALLARAPAVLSAVPATLLALVEQPGGAALLQDLAGGVVGGAPVSAELAGHLTGTALRAGYGQTEASPGIALGEPGRWRAGLLGRPLGCEVRLVAGSLEFRGENACLGRWGPDGLEVLDPARWVATGDAVDLVDGDLVFRGRTADHFKLANGRWVETTVLEPSVRGALPEVTDAVVHSADGRSLDLLVVVPGGAPHASVDRDAVRGALGPLGRALGEVRVVRPEAVVRDRKGALDRAATLLGARG